MAGYVVSRGADFVGAAVGPLDAASVPLKARPGDHHCRLGIPFSPGTNPQAGTVPMRNVDPLPLFEGGEVTTVGEHFHTLPSG